MGRQWSSLQETWYEKLRDSRRTKSGVGAVQLRFKKLIVAFTAHLRNLGHELNVAGHSACGSTHATSHEAQASSGQTDNNKLYTGSAAGLGSWCRCDGATTVVKIQRTWASRIAGSRRNSLPQRHGKCKQHTSQVIFSPTQCAY